MSFCPSRLVLFFGWDALLMSFFGWDASGEM